MASEAAYTPDFAPNPERPDRVTKPPPWGWLITADLMLSELSSGLFMLAALSDLTAHDVLGAAARIGYLMAFPPIVADLFCLVADLGDPLRFHHMLRVLKVRSPMSSGVWAISAFSLFAFVCFMLAAAAPAVVLPRLVIAAIGLVFALYVSGYKGVLFSATAQGYWKDARWLGAELTSAAACLGAAGMLLAATLLSLPAAIEPMRRALIALLLLNLLLSVPFFINLASHSLNEISPARAAGYVLLLVFNWVAPLVLSFVGGTAELTAAGCLVIAFNFLFRHDLVQLPHRAIEPAPAPARSPQS